MAEIAWKAVTEQTESLLQSPILEFAREPVTKHSVQHWFGRFRTSSLAARRKPQTDHPHCFPQFPACCETGPKSHSRGAILHSRSLRAKILETQEGVKLLGAELV